MMYKIMEWINSIKGLKLENELKDILLRNSQVKSIEGSLSIKKEVKEIICLDLDLSIIEKKVLKFEDYNLYNIFFEINFNIFIEDINEEARFENFKICSVINKKSYLKDKSFEVDIIDGIFCFNNNELKYSLVILIH